jgi:hypothetical protein
VSARSWGERITTEHTGHTEKREKGKGKRVGAGDPMISFSFSHSGSFLSVLGVSA